MSALTTRQRDLLQLLLRLEEPQGTATIAAQLQLTPRQVSYDLKGLREWLQRKNISLDQTPGVGVSLHCSQAELVTLGRELAAISDFQLVLSVEQRQQLLAFSLLIADGPLVLHYLCDQAQISRTTVLKDLDVLEGWLGAEGLTLARRPNVGVWVEGSEQRHRQALSKLLWGQTDWREPLVQLGHRDGMLFELAADRTGLPIVNQAYLWIRQCDLRKSLGTVAYAEAQLGGRFTDDAVLYLALAFAIQASRVQSQHEVTVDVTRMAWLSTTPVWSTATHMAERLGWYWPAKWSPEEVAMVCMYLLAAPRNERWPSDLEIDLTFADLVDDLVARIGQAYDLPGLSEDKTLRDGLANHILPACLRQRFDLWMPSLPPGSALPSEYMMEYTIAQDLNQSIESRTGVRLAEVEVDSLALLLRAAYVRERPDQVHEVLVVCPSGIATAQLLVARLKAHFPRLRTFRVVSMRELGHQAANAQLIITTIPLPYTKVEGVDVIQVHPLLLPEDIERITQWLAQPGLSSRSLRQ